MAAGFSDEIPRDVTVEWVAYRYRDVHHRLRHLESVSDKYNPAVQDLKIEGLVEDMQALKRAFYTFAFSVVGSSILFAFTVFALLGKHP